MAAQDVVLYEDATNGYPGDTVFNVAAGSTASINAGEFVLATLGGVAVTAWGTSVNTKPVVATDFVAGLAASKSTETASAAGTVRVMKFVPGVSYLLKPTVAGSWDTQAKYDALVGKRLLLDAAATTGIQTVLASDGATYGLVVLPMDITLHPGKVRVALRNGLNYLT